MDDRLDFNWNNIKLGNKVKLNNGEFYIKTFYNTKIVLANSYNFIPSTEYSINMSHLTDESLDIVEVYESKNGRLTNFGADNWTLRWRQRLKCVAYDDILKHLTPNEIIELYLNKYDINELKVINRDGNEWIYNGGEYHEIN